MYPPITRCDGPGLRRLAEAGLAWLTANQEIVNALNVFPIPDGDTGTNLVLTMQAACKEAAGRTDRSAGAVARHLAQGALMGARGNSGVILSQLWRGFARAVGEHAVFDGPVLAAAMREATETAYKGVVKPVEGTILTVSKDVAAAGEAAVAESQDLRLVLEQVVAAANASVARTPELLPVLKQAGVVDSGGKGLALLFEGMLRHVRGERLDQTVAAPIKTLDLAAIGAAMDAVEPGQEWETVVDFRPSGELDVAYFYSRLEAMGTSIQVGSGEELYRVHIHLLKEKRYEPIELAEQLGTVVNVHMENLLDQVADKSQQAAKPAPTRAAIDPGHIGVVAVAPGPGIAQLFLSANAAVVNGGQTKNPSTEEILSAIESLLTDRVVVLPNNKNIILAAEQARDLSSKQVAVVPTRSVPEGFAALDALTLGGDLAAEVAKMARRAKEIETGEVTTASRSVELNGVFCQAGQVIGLRNGVLEVADESPIRVVLHLLEKMDAENREDITLYHGAQVAAEDLAALVAEIEDRYPDARVIAYEGGQPHYYYILSTE